MKNRQPMTDEQRRAMFARLHGSSGASRGGSGGASESGAGFQPAGGTSTNVPSIGASGSGKVQSLEPTEADLRNPSYQPWSGTYRLEGGSVSSADMDFLQFLPGTKGAQTFAKNLFKPLGKVGDILASWKTPVAAALAALGIGKYRDKHPTMEPEFEKVLAIAQQISGYVSALTGIGATKDLVGKAAPKTLAKGSAWLKDLGEAIELSGKSLAEILPTKLRDALAKLHGGYTKVADVTGASIADLKNVPRIRSMLDEAASLREAADAARVQAAEIETSASQLALDMKDQAGRILKSSHKGSLADWESAQRMYGEGAAKWYAAQYGEAASKRVAREMREQAVKLEEQAVQVTRDAQMAAVKGAIVVAGFTAKELTEEARIRELQRQMEAAYANGESFTLPAEQPRGTLATAGAFVLGTLGNPIEKQTRYGADFQAAQTANYRAKYEAIGRAERSGELTSAEAEAARLELAQSEKPWNMAGKGAWTFAPASAAFVAWQGQQLSDYFSHEVEVGTVAKVLDGDTLELAGGKIVRMLGVDTPESVHPDKPVEYLGPEASHYQKDRLTGKTVRLVQSPGVDTDKYGRALRYVETLPGPLDAAFSIPGVGKWIPGADQNENMIELGFGQPRYLELSGGHERKKEYDAAVERAKRAGAGVWTPEGMERLAYHYTPRGGSTNDASRIGNLLGAGLMLTGQSGALREMGPAGNAIAQTWNAALAGIGAAEFNAKASGRTNAIVFRPTRGLKTDFEKQADAVITKRRHDRAR